MARTNRTINLRHISNASGSTYPALGTPSHTHPALRFLQDDFDLGFDRAITIIVGENGTGKSTLLEGIAALASYDEAGGGKGYMPVDHSTAIEAMGGKFSAALRASLRQRFPTVGFSARNVSFRWPAISTTPRCTPADA